MPKKIPFRKMRHPPMEAKRDAGRWQVTEHLPNRTERFDNLMERLTQDRGSVYGHPLDDFTRVSILKTVISQCADPQVRHALEMIAVKIARLIQTPDHEDSAIDVAGYARTICMVHDERRRREDKKIKDMSERIRAEGSG